MRNNYLYILIAFAVIYLIRVLPLTLIRKPIRSRFIRSFLYYVPYVTLAVMTFPAIVEATAVPAAGIAALAVGIVAAFLGGSLLSSDACRFLFSSNTGSFLFSSDACCFFRSGSSLSRCDFFRARSGYFAGLLCKSDGYIISARERPDHHHQRHQESAQLEELFILNHLGSSPPFQVFRIRNLFSFCTIIVPHYGYIFGYI